MSDTDIHPQFVRADHEGDRIQPITITYENAEKVTGFSVRTLRRMVSRGEIRAKKYGRKVLLSWPDLRSIIDALPMVMASDQSSHSEEMSQDAA